MRGNHLAVVWLALAACGNTRSWSDDVEISPDVLRFCCDPEGEFPQHVGDVTVTNRSTTDVAEVTSGGDTYPFAPEVSDTVPVYVASCEDTSVALEVRGNTPYEVEITIENACPSLVEDPPNPEMGDPALDLRSVETTTYDGIVDAVLDFEADWPPPETLYSWYVRVTFAIENGSPVFVCIVERHDGVDDTYCPTGDVANLTTSVDTGLRLSYDVGEFAPATFAVTGNVLPTAGGTLTTDTVEGAAGVPGP